MCLILNLLRTDQETSCTITMGHPLGLLSYYLVSPKWSVPGRVCRAVWGARSAGGGCN